MRHEIGGRDLLTAAHESLERGLYRAYYRYAALLNRLLPNQRTGEFALQIPPGVYRPIQNEGHIAPLIPAGGRALDVGCGCGVFALCAALRCERVLAIDVNPAALRATRENAAAHGLSNVHTQLGDAFQWGETCALRFDAILSNPPFAELSLPGVEKQWATAVDFLPRLFALANRLLAGGGVLIVHHLARRSTEIEAEAARHGLELARVVPNHQKGVGLRLLGWLSLQPGMRTAFHIFRASDPQG